MEKWEIFLLSLTGIGFVFVVIYLIWNLIQSNNQQALIYQNEISSLDAQNNNIGGEIGAFLDKL